MGQIQNDFHQKIVILQIIWIKSLQLLTLLWTVMVLKGDTDASILDGVKIVQKSKQWSIENKSENQKKYFSTEQFRESYLVSQKSAKSVHCWRPNIFGLNWRKKCGKFKSVLFWRYLKYWHRYHPLVFPIPVRPKSVLRYSGLSIPIPEKVWRYYRY
jgi:hypothetical protein